MNEKPFYFKNEKANLFGILHIPDVNKYDTGYLFCHPLLEEKLWAHRVYVNFARELAARGYYVLRFDYMGHGDSEGEFEDSTIESRLADINCAIKTLENEVKEVCLLGLRFGATLAALTAAKRNNISKLIMWEPIINCESYMQELLRINLTTQTAVYKKILFNREALINEMKSGKHVSIDGYKMSHELFSQASSVDLLSNIKNFHGDSLIVHISRNAAKIKKEIEEFHNNYDKAELRVAVEHMFWKEIKIFYSKADNLFNETLKWIEKYEK